MYSIKFIRLIAFFSVLISVISQPAAAIESFTRINTNEISRITNARLFFVTSEHGFVHNRKTGSPLQEDVPSEIAGSKYDKTESVDTVLVQSIETNEQDFKTLEGGLPGGKWIWIIIGGVLGGIVAPFFRQEQMLGAIVGAIAMLLIGSSIYESDDFRLYVDNATEQNILFIVDSFPPIAISAKSQVGVKFKEGTHNVKARKASDNSDLEHFEISAIKYKNKSGDNVSGYYIYNVSAVNDYAVNHVVYSPKK